MSRLLCLLIIINLVNVIWGDEIENGVDYLNHNIKNSTALPESEKQVYDTKGYIQIHNVPFLVSISYKDLHYCGGSIIRIDVILTAAHCLVGMNTTRLKVRTGSSFNYTGGIVSDVKKYSTHPNYSKQTKDCDIGLIWLTEPLVISDVVKAIELAKPGQDVNTGTFMSVSGFGHDAKNQYPDILQAVIVPVVDSVQCDEIYSHRRITENMMCAGYKTGGADSCRYDSGGPLVHNNTQYGVVSFGRGVCANPRYPGVYARISTLRSWIDSQLDAENNV